MTTPIRVLIVDDSAIVRNIFSRELGKSTDIEIVGTAPDPYVARDKIIKLQPDVVTLDIEMPRMDGLTFLRKLMPSYPLPVIVVSGMTPQGCAISMEALEVGAIDVMEKPQLDSDAALADFTLRLSDKIRAAASVKMERRTRVATQVAQRQVPIAAPRIPAGTVIAIGASTGGTEALKVVLEQMPVTCPPIVIVQHMPAKFTGAFARRLNEQCTIEVCEAEPEMMLKAGRAIIAQGDHHLMLQRVPMGLAVKLKSGPLVCRHRPSVEVLFNSVAKVCPRKAVGVIMTGMGSDGAQGLKTLRDAGSRTIAQNEATCVVYGMPKEAVKLGAAEMVVSLDKIPETVFSFFR